MSQFAVLNVVWAITIVALEVPSGALADVMGRRNLMIIAAVLMVIEMVVFASLPVGGPWVFWVFLVNRVFSGAAEAFASGADEALAYESIAMEQRSALWPRVMGRLSRWMALGFIACSLIGAFVYDAANMNRVLHAIGFHGTALSKATTLKFPIYLCVLTALATLTITLLMDEPRREKAVASFGEKVGASWRSIRNGALWIWRTPAAFYLMMLGFMLDSIVRLFYTVASNFYRFIGIEEASFGVISTAVSVAAFFTSSWMEWLVKHRSVRFNFGVVIAMVAWGLLVLAHPVRGWWGVTLLAPILLSMRFLQFFLSHYLNATTDSAHRATVLSFKGSSMNLAYGAVTLLFGWQTAWLSGRMNLGNGDVHVFAAALTWWPWWFAGTMALYLFVRVGRRRAEL